MTRRRQHHGERSRVGVHHLVVLITLVLIAASGTAFTASLTGTPRTSVMATATEFPDFQATAPVYGGADLAVTVTFSVSPDAGQVQVRIQPADGPARTFQPCTTGGAGSWTCPVPDLTLEQAQASAFSFFANP